MGRMTRRRPNWPPTSSRRTSGPEVLIAIAARRIALGLQRIIGLVAPDAPGVDFDDVQPSIYELLLLCDVITSYQLARFLGHGPGSAPTTRLTASRVELEQLVVADELDDETWKAIASWDLSAATRSDGGHPLAVHLATLTKQIIDEFPDPPESLRSPAAEVLRQLKTGGTTPEDLDLALLPLAAESVASDQPIEFVRIAGNVVLAGVRRVREARSTGPTKDRRSPVAPPRRVLRRDWRTNDWWWGRLDSVRALLDVVLDREAMQIAS